MSIFDLHRDVLADYRDFVRCFLVIADEKARRFVDKALEEEARLWPDFLAQVSPSYATGLTVMELARHGAITAETAEVFQRPDGSPFTLLRFLVFDELHTYRGRQGADVAMLVRRLKERCAAPGLIHVGTSATMVAHPAASTEDRRQAVAEFVIALLRPFLRDRARDRGNAVSVHRRRPAVAGGSDCRIVSPDRQRPGRFQEASTGSMARIQVGRGV